VTPAVTAPCRTMRSQKPITLLELLTPFHSSVMAEQPPQYLNGRLSYINSRSLRPSPPTLEQSEYCFYPALPLFSPSPEGLEYSRQVLYLLTTLDTSLGRNPLICKDSRSSVSPRRPLYLYNHSVTPFFTPSSFTNLFYFLSIRGLGP
jgi:hypothetical protein